MLRQHLPKRLQPGPKESVVITFIGVALRGNIDAAQPLVHIRMPNTTLLGSPVAIYATEAPARIRPSVYPAPFALRVTGRTKRPLGDLFGLTNFGVNLTRLEPQAVSSLRHAHSRQDEFVFILEGHPVLLTDEGRTQLSPGMCAGFKAGTGNAHCLLNESGSEVVYLEIGDRRAGDEGTYPDDDLQAVMGGGRWQFFHKDGTPY